MTFRTLLPLFAVACLAPLAGGCLDFGVDDPFGPSATTFDPVDEDFARPSPALALSSALQRSCEEEEPSTPLLRTREEASFGHALCLCGDLDNVGSGLVTRSRSYLLGSDPGRGHVGINGSVNVVGDFQVDGTFDVARGLQGVGNVTVDGDLISGDGVEITGSWDVGGDAWIDGDLRGVGSLVVGDGLFLSGDLRTVGSVEYGSAHKGFAYAGAPCGCDAGQLIDVAAEVAAHRDDNDNGSLVGGVGSSQLVLESGAYHFGSASELVGSGSITVRGHATVYVEGDISSVGSLEIAVEPEGELSLWVAGRIETVGNVTFAPGDDRPRAFRLFMGGEGSSIVSVGSAEFVGAIYAPTVDIEYVGDLSVSGALFGRSISGTASLTIEHDTDLITPRTCAERKYEL